MSRHLLSADEEAQLLDCLPWRDGVDDWLRALCAARLTPHRRTTTARPPPSSFAAAAAARTPSAPAGEEGGDRFSHPALRPLLGGGAYADPGPGGGGGGSGGSGGGSGGGGSGEDRGSALRAREPNAMVLAAKAELLWYQHDAQGAHALCREARALDPAGGGGAACLPVYLACLVELGRTQDLFLVAHQVVHKTRRGGGGRELAQPLGRRLGTAAGSCGALGR